MACLRSKKKKAQGVIRMDYLAPILSSSFLHAFGILTMESNADCIPDS